MTKACPSCGESLRADADVCSRCLHVIDRAAWDKHDAGRLGADDRGGGQPLEDVPVGPIPVTGGMAGGDVGGALAGALRLLTATLLAGSRKVRGRR